MNKHLPPTRLQVSVLFPHNIDVFIAAHLLLSVPMPASANENQYKETELPRRSKIKAMSLEQMLANVMTTQEELATMCGEINTSLSKPNSDSTQENQRKEAELPRKSKINVLNFDQMLANITTTQEEPVTELGEINTSPSKPKPDSPQEGQREEDEVPRKLKPKVQNFDEMVPNISTTQQELTTSFNKIDLFTPVPEPDSTQYNQHKEDEVPRKSRIKSLNFDQMLANVSTTQQELATKLGDTGLLSPKLKLDYAPKGYDKELYYCIKSQASLFGISYYLQSKYDGLDNFRTFHLFPNLPDELQVMIFEYMMPERHLSVERINEFDVANRHFTQRQLVQVQHNQWEWQKQCGYTSIPNEWRKSKQYTNPQSYLEDRKHANLPDIFKAQKHEIPALLQVYRMIRYEMLKPDGGHYTRIFASASCPGMLVNFGRDTLELFTHNPIWHRPNHIAAGYADTLKWWSRLERARTKAWLERDNNGCTAERKATKRSVEGDRRIYWEVVNPGLEEKRAEINAKSEALRAARGEEIKEWMNAIVKKARWGEPNEVGAVNHKSLEYQAKLELKDTSN